MLFPTHTITTTLANKLTNTFFQIVQNTRSVINGYTESVLKTWPVQSAMDMFEAILNTANNTLDNVLPPAKDEDAGKPGLVAVGEQEKHKRGIILVQRTYHMFSTAFRRVFGICQTQVENAASATDTVYKHVRNAVVRPKPFYTVTL